MNIPNDIKDKLALVWDAKDEILKKKINVSAYDSLKSNIPDHFLSIDEVFTEDAIVDVYEEYLPFISDFDMLPFIGNYGNIVTCIGFGEKNKGYIYYFDFVRYVKKL